MRSLSGTLTTAQQTGGKFLCKIVLTKTNQTTRTYDNDSTTNRILSISPHNEQIWNQTAEVVIDNRDGNLTSLDLRGYAAVISNGYNTSAGDEYSGGEKPTLIVIYQRIETWGGDSVCVLSLASKVNQMSSDKALADYLPSSANADTVETLVDRIGEAGSFLGTTDTAGAIKTLALVGATQLELKSLGTGTINKSAKLTIAGDTTIYSVTAQATIATNEATVSISPGLVAQAAVDAVVTLSLAVFSHCENIGVGGSLDADKDPTISSFKPADFFTINYGANRRSKIEELLAYTFSALRMASGAALQWVQYANAHAKAWTAATLIRKGETVKPTTANGHIYICTTQGTTHATTQPTWPTTEGQTVADNTVVWTLDYDYQYARETGSHNFWRKGLNQPLVVPNKITVESHPTHSPIYSQSATDSVSNALLAFEDGIRLRLTSADEASNIAKGILDHHQINTDIGFIIAPFNVGLELYDLIRAYDSWDGTSMVGNVMQIQNYYSPGRAYQIIRLGLNATSLGITPTSLSFPDRSESEMATYGDILGLRRDMDYYDTELLNLIEGLQIKVLATLAEVNAGTDAVKVITPDILAGSIFGEKRIYLKVIADDTALTTGDGKMYVTMPDSLNGMNLVDADGAIYTVSSSGLPTVQIYNATKAVDMLSTLITIDVNEKTSYTAETQPVIDTTKDDVATGDQLRIDCDIAGTGTKGLDILLTFRRP